MSSDKSLIADFLSTRSEKSFREIYKANSPSLYPMALRLTAGDQETSQEILQKTWVTAIERLPSFEFRSSFKTWITGILINHCRQQHRQELKRPIDLDETSRELPVTHPIDSMDLEKAINSLSPGYRQAIELHDIQGYTHKEISQLTEMSEGTSKSQLFMARRAMRNYLNDTNHG